MIAVEPYFPPALLFGLAASALIALGLFGVVVNPAPLRKLLAFNLVGAGVFMMFGVVGRRGAAAGLATDPVPQAMVITGLVVAFAATAIAAMLIVRLFQTTGAATLADDAPVPLPAPGQGSGGAPADRP